MNTSAAAATLQVPQKLVTVCCQQPNTVQLMSHPFVLAVRCLLFQGGNLCGDTNSSISMAETLLQQLQHSGLLQHIAAAMSVTKAHIWELQTQAGSEVLSAGLADPAYEYQKPHINHNSSSLQQLHLHAGQLCACVQHLQDQLSALQNRTNSDRWHRLLLPVAIPALELSVLTAQHVSTCLELLPARVVSPPHALRWALFHARYATKYCVAWYSISYI
jgi:hypothetical protein